MTEQIPDAELGAFNIDTVVTRDGMITTDGDGIGRLADLVDAAREPRDLGDGRLGFVVPADHQVNIVDTEKWGDAPTTRKGEVRVSTPRSLAAYVNRHGDNGTTFWADKGSVLNDRGQRSTPKVLAVLDDDATGTTAWREHRAVLDLVHTQDWKDWTSISGRPLRQVEFAEFIEDHVTNIVRPTAADMLELAQTFEATKAVDFESSNRINSGERRLVYKETVQARAGQKGDIVVPEVVTLSIAPFEGVEPVTLDARFRYRLAGGDLTLTVVIDRPEKVIDNTFAVILDDLAETTKRPTESMLGATEGEDTDPVPVYLDIYFGTPGPARR